jgi:hypothetical protein
MLDLLGATELSPKEADAIARVLCHLNNDPYITYPRSVSVQFDGGDQILVEALGTFGPTRWLLRAGEGAEEYTAFIGALIRREFKGGAAGRC